MFLLLAAKLLMKQAKILLDFRFRFDFTLRLIWHVITFTTCTNKVVKIDVFLCWFNWLLFTRHLLFKWMWAMTTSRAISHKLFLGWLWWSDKIMLLKRARITTLRVVTTSPKFLAIIFSWFKHHEWITFHTVNVNTHFGVFSQRPWRLCPIFGID